MAQQRSDGMETSLDELAGLRDADVDMKVRQETARLSQTALEALLSARGFDDRGESLDAKAELYVHDRINAVLAYREANGLS